MESGFPTGVENMEGTFQNFMRGVSQYMGRMWGDLNSVEKYL